MGAMVNSLGCREWVAWPTIRASGSRPLSSASEHSRRAEAPSEMELELAAVMVPSALKAGRSVGIRSTFALPGCSSSETVLLPITKGAISAVSSPSSIASRARRSDSIA